MKKYLLPLSLLLGIACAEKPTDESGRNLSFSFSLDTVKVDAGEDFIYLQHGLNTADLSRDGRYLYNFNLIENALEVIDMDKLALDRKVAFEKEGPNGTGKFQISHFRQVGDDKFLLTDFMNVNLFDGKSERKKNLNLRNTSFVGDVLEEDENITTAGVIEEESNKFIGLYQTSFVHQKGLAVIDLETQELRKIPIEALGKLEKFSLLWQDGGASSAWHPSIQLLNHKGKILISNSAINELWMYDLDTETFSTKTYQSNLTENSQREVKSTRVGSQDEINKLGRERVKDVHFGNWLYDEISQRHFRFTRQFVRENTEGKNEFKLVLTVFDEHFDQIYESEDLPIQKASSKMFFRNGNLYLFENINDELAFVVLTINEG